MDPAVGLRAPVPAPFQATDADILGTGPSTVAPPTRMTEASHSADLRNSVALSAYTGHPDPTSAVELREPTLANLGSKYVRTSLDGTWTVMKACVDWLAENEICGTEAFSSWHDIGLYEFTYYAAAAQLYVGVWTGVDLKEGFW